MVDEPKVKDPPIQASAKFFAALEGIADEMRRAKERPDFNDLTAHLERFAAFMAVLETVKFVDAIAGRDSQLSAPLVRLMLALDNVMNGRADAILKPDRAGGRPELPILVMNLRGRFGAVLDMFMKSGMSEKEAAKKVFRALDAATLRRLAVLTGASFSVRLSSPSSSVILAST